MAQKIAKWGIFLRAFMISLIAAQPAKMGHAQSSAEESAWQQAAQQNTEQAYHDYLGAYPAGAYVRDAIFALQRLGRIQGAPAARNVGGATRSSGASSGSSGDMY